VVASICAILGPWHRHPKKMGSASAIRTRSHPDQLCARAGAAKPQRGPCGRDSR